MVGSGVELDGVYCSSQAPASRIVNLLDAIQICLDNSTTETIAKATANPFRRFITSHRAITEIMSATRKPKFEMGTTTLAWPMASPAIRVLTIEKTMTPPSKPRRAAYQSNASLSSLRTL